MLSQDASLGNESWLRQRAKLRMLTVLLRVEVSFMLLH